MLRMYKELNSTSKNLIIIGNIAKQKFLKKAYNWSMSI
jgi:hypothetical protein